MNHSFITEFFSTGNEFLFTSIFLPENSTLDFQANLTDDWISIKNIEFLASNFEVLPGNKGREFLGILIWIFAHFLKIEEFQFEFTALFDI